MPMVTRCPACETMFRVTPQQLQAHRGRVRCGRCMTVFDGFTTLATLPEQEVAPLSVAPPTNVAPGVEPYAPGTRVETADDRTEALHQPQRPAPERVAREPALLQSSALDSALEPAKAAVDRMVSPGSESAVADIVGQAVASTAEDPPEAGSGRPSWRRVSPYWAAGAALMLVALGVQAAYAYRVDLLASLPALRPFAAQLCGALGCSLPLPQRPKLLSIEASDLQVQDPARPSVIQLTATLRNHAGYAVGYPALDLVLTNTKEHTLARRLFMPEEYLETGHNVAAGLAPDVEFTVRLTLDTGGLGAAGFRLALQPASLR